MKLTQTDDKWYRLELDSGVELAFDDDELLDLHLQIHKVFGMAPAVAPKYYGTNITDL